MSKSYIMSIPHKTWNWKMAVQFSKSLYGHISNSRLFRFFLPPLSSGFSPHYFNNHWFDFIAFFTIGKRASFSFRLCAYLRILKMEHFDNILPPLSQIEKISELDCSSRRPIRTRPNLFLISRRIRLNKYRTWKTGTQYGHQNVLEQQACNQF